MKERLHHISFRISTLAGSTWTFCIAVLGVMTWLISGPYFHYSNTWLVTISTVTSIVVFLMAFSIQSTQNRDTKAIHLKLNELIASNAKARDAFIGLESLTDAELAEIDDEFKQLLTAVTPVHALHVLHTKITEEKTQRTLKKRARL